MNGNPSSGPQLAASVKPHALVSFPSFGEIEHAKRTLAESQRIFDRGAYAAVQRATLRADDARENVELACAKHWLDFVTRTIAPTEPFLGHAGNMVGPVMSFLGKDAPEARAMAERIALRASALWWRAHADALDAMAFAKEVSA